MAYCEKCGGTCRATLPMTQRGTADRDLELLAKLRDHKGAKKVHAFVYGALLAEDHEIRVGRGDQDAWRCMELLERLLRGSHG